MTNCLSNALDATPQVEGHTQHILGMATFDPNGLPQNCFVSTEGGDSGWVQAVFQSLGLHFLLLTSLQMEGFHHIAIRGEEYLAIVLKQQAGYTALLLRLHTSLSPQFLRWAQALEPTLFSLDPRFSQIQ